MNTADDRIFYMAHRIMVTAIDSNIPYTALYQFTPLCGPQELFEFKPITLVNPSTGTNSKGKE